MEKDIVTELSDRIQNLQDDRKDCLDEIQSLERQIEDAEMEIEEYEHDIREIDKKLEQLQLELNAASESDRLAIFKRLGASPDSKDPMQLNWLTPVTD